MGFTLSLSSSFSCPFHQYYYVHIRLYTNRKSTVLQNHIFTTQKQPEVIHFQRWQFLATIAEVLWITLLVKAFLWDVDSCKDNHLSYAMMHYMLCNPEFILSWKCLLKISYFTVNIFHLQLHFQKLWPVVQTEMSGQQQEHLLKLNIQPPGDVWTPHKDLTALTEAIINVRALFE